MSQTYSSRNKLGDPCYVQLDLDKVSAFGGEFDESGAAPGKVIGVHFDYEFGKVLYDVQLLDADRQPVCQPLWRLDSCFVEPLRQCPAK